jgi:hypothetical protein
VGARNVAEREDHRHDDEPEGERDTYLAEASALRVDHDRAATEEDERERSARLGYEQSRTLAAHSLTA